MWLYNVTECSHKSFSCITVYRNFVLKEKKGKIHCSPWNYGDVGFGTLHHFHQSISVSNIGSRPYMNCFSLLCLTPTHRTTICVWVSQCMRVWERVLFILRCERGGGGGPVHIRSCICFNEYGIDVFPKLSL